MKVAGATEAAAIGAGLSVGFAAGFALYGLAALGGVLAGALAALAALRIGGGPRAAAVAAALGPLALPGDGAVVGTVVLGLVLTWLGTRRAEVFALGGLAASVAVLVPGALLPPAAEVAIPALAGGALLAVAPWPLALAGVPVALASWAGAPGSLPMVAVAVLLAAGAARVVASHPANATMALRVAGLGAILLPVPSASVFLLSSIGVGHEHVWDVFRDAAMAAGLGILLFSAHVGTAVLLHSADGRPGLWLAMMWGFLAAWAGLSVQLGFRAAAIAAPGMVPLVAVPVGIAIAWSLRTWKGQRVLSRNLERAPIRPLR